MTTMNAKRRAVRRARHDLNLATPRPLPEPPKGALRGFADHPMKIIPQVFRGLGGRRIFVAEVGDGWGVVSEDEMGRRQVLKRFTPSPTFETAEEDLDAYAERKGFQAENPLPADEGEEPEPAPVRHTTGNGRSDTSLLDGGVLPAIPESRLVPLAAVVASPYQTRHEFPEEQLRALGESLRARQLVPIRVRTVDAPKPAVGFVYELIAGERRVRAARLVGLETLRAEVVELTDDEARWEVGADNEERASFNPIERALWFQSLLAAGITQEDLAKRLGWAGQASVSNAVGLLRLPAEPWHGWISAEMLPAGHARAVLPYAEHPELLAAIAERFLKQRTRRSDKIEFGSYDEFMHDVAAEVRTNTRPLDGTDWDSAAVQQIPIFTPTPEQRERLGIIEVPRHTGLKGAAKEERAVHVDLWKSWQGAFLVEWRKTAAAKAGKAKARAADHKPEKLTRRQAEARATEAAEKYEKRLEAVRADWLRWLLSERLRDGRDVDVGMVLGLALYFAASRRPLPPWTSGKEREIARRGEELRAVIPGETGNRMLQDDAAAAAICMFSELPDCAAHVAVWLAAMFWAKDREQEAGHPGQPVPHVPAEDLNAFAVRLGIDVEEAWHKAHCGPLTRRYWELHSKEQLVGMIEGVLGWGKVFAASRPEQHGGRRGDMNTWTKTDIVEALLALRPADLVRMDKRGRERERGLPMPAELRPGGRGPGRRRKGGNQDSPQRHGERGGG